MSIEIRNQSRWFYQTSDPARQVLAIVEYQRPAGKRIFSAVPILVGIVPAQDHKDRPTLPARGGVQRKAREAAREAGLTLRRPNSAWKYRVPPPNATPCDTESVVKHLTTAEAAERLGVGVQRIIQYIREGRLPGARKVGGSTRRGIWLIPEADLVGFQRRTYRKRQGPG